MESGSNIDRRGRHPGSSSRIDQFSDEQQLFAALCEDPSSKARSILIERFMPLARQWAMRYSTRREPLEDLCQVAAVGLIKAVDNYQPQRGTAFTSYAVPTIIGEIKRYFRDKTWGFHVPRGLQEQAIKLAAASGEFEQHGERALSARELANKLNLSESEVVEARSLVRAMRIDSLDRPLFEEGSEQGTLSDVTGGEDPELHEALNRATVSHFFGNLSRREQELLRMRFKEDLTQMEIAERLGCSQMQVSRMLKTILKRLQQSAQDDATGSSARAAS